jgi:Relaxase/Mobilisation nuclease domain.
MATTRLMPLHIGKGNTIAAALNRSIDYVENSEKTNRGELISSYECDPVNADAEFMFAKRQYAMITGKEQGIKDVIAYHLRQSFKPAEIDPEAANKIGYDLAMSLTKGKHAFVVCTHVDKAHIHSHIIFNSTNLECDRKFRNFWGSSFAVRRISDQLCAENGLSIIEKPKPSKGHYGDWLGDKKTPSWRSKLELLIDEIMMKKPADFDEFLRMLEATGCEVKRGKYISVRMNGQQRFARLSSLSDDYTEYAIRERIAGKRTVKTKQPNKVNLLIDIQNNIKVQGSPGYEHWAKIFNLKEAAKTLIYLQENDITDMDLLDERVEKAKSDFNDISDQVHASDKRMKEITELQRHIGTYGKTKDIYAGYRNSGYSQKYLSAHEPDIIRHKAAKKYFDGLGLQKLPSMKSLQAEYAQLSSKKGELYSKYREARKSMIEICIAKQNVDQVLSATNRVQSHKNIRDEI